MTQLYANDAATTLAEDITNTETTVTVSDAGAFPSLVNSGDFYKLVFFTEDGDGNQTADEIVEVTAVNSNDLTVSRGKEGTTAQSWPSGTPVELRNTAASMDRIESHRDDTNNPHNTTASDVGLGNVPNEDATDPANWDQAGAATDDQLKWDGTNWVAFTPSDDVRVLVLAPTPESPADGATGIGETPTLDGGPFFHVYSGKSHALSRFQVSDSTDFSTTVYESGEINGTTTHQVPRGNLNTGTTYYWRVWYEDGDGNRSAWSDAASFTTANSFVTVYGIAQEATGGGAGSWQWIDADGNNVTLATTDFDSHPVWGGMTDETVDGQAMVRVPKFWYLVGNAPAGSNQAGNKSWWVGNGPFSVDGVDAEVHPAFFDAGTEVDQIWVGKYEGIDDGTNGTGDSIVGSASGVSPLISTTFTNYQQYCANRNEANGGNAGQTGWHLWSMFDLGAVQMLALIELGTPDVQTAIADGRVNASDAANTGSTTAVYRGISELWGNVWHWTDGLEIDGSGVIKIWDRTGNQTWVNTGVNTLHDQNADGWTITMHDESGVDYNLADVFQPATVDGTESNGTFADNFFGSDAGEVNKVFHGGSWSGGSKAGLFSLNCIHEASFSSSSLGGRLAKV